MSDRETAQRIAERHMGALSKAWAANLAIDIEDAITTARREPPAPWLVEAARNLETAIARERNVQAVLGIHRIDCEPCVEMEGNACRDGAVMLKELRACRKATDAAMNALRAALPKETK